MMKVICAGLSKTGTKSLAAALRYLGYTVHDANEQWFYHLQEHTEAFEGKVPDYKRMYENVDAIVDVSAYFFYKDIFKAFPEAKVVLSIRDSEEVWNKSFENNVAVVKPVLNHWLLRILKMMTPTGRRWNKNLDLEFQLIAAGLDYKKHNDEVAATIPRDQLLVFNCKQGWDPLCKFLGNEVPDIPFPRQNVNNAILPDYFLNADIVKRMKKEFIAMLTLLMVALAVGFTIIWW